MKKTIVTTFPTFLRPYRYEALRDYCRLSVAFLFAIAVLSAVPAKAQYSMYIWKADSLFLCGEYAQSSAMFDKAFQEERDIQGYHLYNAACAAALAGDADVAFQRLFARLEKEPGWYSETFEHDEDLMSLHGDARWKVFVDSNTVRQERAERHFDRPLRQRLKQIGRTDQAIRHQFLRAFNAQPRNQAKVDSLEREMQRIDRQNQKEICDILDKRGFVGSQVVGDACEVFWVVIQHASAKQQRKYLPEFQKAVARGDMSLWQVAMMEDRIDMFEGRPQKYGSQTVEAPDGSMVLYQLLDPMKVDTWRKEVGMEPLAEYLRKQGARMPVEMCTNLADYHYHRGNYRQTANLLKLVPEDSLSHEAFRQLCNSYQRLGDNSSFVWWASALVARFPEDGEMVAGLTTALVREKQAWKGIDYAAAYFKKDSTHILVNRALADAYFMDRKFDLSAAMYERLLQLGDSTFTTLYSAGMCYSQLDSLNQAYKCLLPALYLSQMQHANCAYRLGVVSVDLRNYDEGLRYLNLATELMRPDTTIMKAITLSQGEGYYQTHQYDKALEAWKRHLDYNPSSIATYYNIANIYAYLQKDDELAKTYYQQFLDLARKEKNPNAQLSEMIEKAEELLKYYEAKNKLLP